MNNKKLTYFKNILLAKRKYILDTIERLKDVSQLKDDNYKEKNSFDSENFEIESQGKEEYFLIIEREIKYLNHIEDTLKSIEQGIYGICKFCNKEIPYERLEAVPTANTCVSCKSVHDKKQSVIF
jgi:RNA polymerase-binding protein DksA